MNRLKGLSNSRFFFVLGALACGALVSSQASIPSPSSHFFEFGDGERDSHKTLPFTSPIGSTLIRVDPAQHSIEQSRFQCDQLKEMILLSLNQVPGSDPSQAQVDCEVGSSLDAQLPWSKATQEKLQRYPQVFTFETLLDGRNRLRVENHDQTAMRDPKNSVSLAFDRLEWVLDKPGSHSQRQVVQKIFHQFYSARAGARYWQEFLLARVVSESRAIRLQEDGTYQEITSKKPLSFEEAYQRFLDESPRHRHWLKAITEIGIVLGAGTLWYYRNKDLNAEDWEYAPSWEGLRKKYHQGIRFDSNSLWLNSPGHPIVGGLYYGFARNNGLSSLESLLMATAASGVWELAVEFREVLSINDMIFTPLGGAVIGEALHQLKEVFARSKDSWIHRTLLGLFGGASALDHWVSKHKPPRAEHLTESGFPEDVGHSFQVWLGAEKSGTSDAWNLGFKTQVVPIPGYGGALRESKIYWSTPQTRLGFETSLGEDAQRRLEFYAEAAWAGYHLQAIEDQGTQAVSRLSGYSFLINAASGYSHATEQLSETEQDELAVVNVLGPSIEVLLLRGDWKVRLQLQAFGDFAAVHSVAVEPLLRAGGDLSFAKTVLRLHHYYFAFGLTERTSAEISRGPVRFGFEVTRRSYASVEGLDRFQAEVTEDFPLADQAQALRLWIGARLPKERLEWLLEVERAERTGTLVTGTGRRFSAEHARNSVLLRFLYHLD